MSQMWIRGLCHARFCSSCGCSLTNGASMITTLEQPSMKTQAQAESPGTGLDIFLSILFAIIALFIFPPLFGGLGIYFGYRVKQKGKEGLGIALMVLMGHAC